ncbi:MAG: endonuclease [Flavobacteriales bacterium]|nr:endonuclease [Flavobacteriales bacterium]MBO72145.1 endonuclease [Flavobacteriales bacterium]|tara:strand:+ start:449 stop:823 length:375 start_codon:yes stop_codon:yes gene_type:complete
MALHNQLGKEGEKIAVKYLKNRGYLIHHTNWRMSNLEVDIIAEDKEELVFVEVKTRSSSEYGEPEEAVVFKKEKDLIRIAAVYLENLELEVSARFDIISIIIENEKSNIIHFEDAFSSMTSGMA